MKENQGKLSHSSSFCLENTNGSFYIPSLAAELESINDWISCVEDGLKNERSKYVLVLMQLITGSFFSFSTLFQSCHLPYNYMLLIQSNA